MAVNQDKTPGSIPSALTLVGLIALFMGERILADGQGRTIATGLGAALLVGAVALRVQSFLTAKGEAKRVESRILFGYVGVAIALAVYVVSTDTGLNWLQLSEESREKAEGILKTLWPTILLVSVAALVSMELAYRKMPLAQAVELRRVRLASQSTVSLALIAIFLFSINYVANKRDIKKDLSYFKTTRPSETTLAMVKKLDTPLRIVLFYPQVNEVLDQAQPFFEELKRSSSKIKLEVHDHALVPKLAREQRVQGNGHVLLLRGEKDGPNVQNERFEIGVDLEAARSKLKTLDATFQEKFSKLTKTARSLYLTVGHGERSAGQREGYDQGDNTLGMKEFLGRFNIQTSQLGMAQGLASGVPSTAGAVAVVGPRDPFIKEEAEALLAYAQNGGRLFVMVDPDVPVGLEPLYQGLGIKILPGTVVSDRQHIRRTHTIADRATPFANEYSSHPSVTTSSRHSKEVAAVFFGGAALANADGPKATPAPTVTYPVRSSMDFWRDLNGNYERDGEEKPEKLNLMAAVTFPKKGDREGRVVIIGDGDFITDKLIQNPGNTLPFIDSLRWLIGEEEISGDLKSEEDVPIEHTNEEDKLWFYLTTFAVPLPVIGTGIWVSRRRRRRGEGKKS